MRQENWIQRKPGSISGSVVPPPVADKPRAPLPERRIPRRSGHHVSPERSASGSAPPRLPDSVRALFQPVLHPAEPARAEPARAEPARAEPASAEPVRAEPARAEPARAEPARAEPAPAERVRAESFHADAVTEASGAAVAELTAGTRQGPVREVPLAAAPEEHAAKPIRPSGARRLATRARWPSQPAAGSGLRRRIAWITALAVLLGTAAGTTVALLRLNAIDVKINSADAGGSGGKSLAGLSSSAVARVKAADWVAAQVSRSAIVACDTVMCGDLYKAGLPGSDLLVLRTTAADPLGADLIVATPALRSQFGSRLSTEYAPSVLASFGSGRARVQVRAIAADGAAAYQRALTSDVAARKRFGAQLTGNKRITLTVPATAALVTGQVDSRLLLMLPVMAAQHPIQVLGFFDRAAGASQGVPLTGIELAGTDSAAGLPDRAYHRWLLSFLLSQRPPYRAASVLSASHGGHMTVSVRFAIPSPIGLIKG
jgi:hypothetical protein